MEKMAGGGMETNDQTVYSNVQWTSIERKHLIEASIWKRTPGSCRLFFARTVVESTKADVAMLSSAPCTLCLYIDARMYAQDHPVAGPAPLPTRRSRIAARKCEEAS